MFNFRTDIADERTSIYKKINKIDEIDGVSSEEIEVNDHIKKTKIIIDNEEGEKALGKPAGVYVTIDFDNLSIANNGDLQEASDFLSTEIKSLIDMHIGRQDEILIVGLGNEYVTPDSLGPKVIADIDVTRHIIEYMPECLDKETRSVCAISPGVLGTTGIETVEILKGIVQTTKPKLIIVIDALASRNINRISKSIQLSDTGIIPGAGVGNKRNEISVKTLNIPVVSIGVPMVVDLATITNNCLNIFIENLQDEGQSNDYLNKMKNEDNYEKIKSALLPNDFNMIVTPKEIDELIDNMKNIIARAINYAIN